MLNSEMNDRLWLSLCTPAAPYELKKLQAVLADFAIDGAFAPTHPDLEIIQMRKLAERAVSPTAARLGMTASGRTAAIRVLLQRSELTLYHPHLIEIWATWLDSSDYRENYQAVGRAVDPIAPIAAADTVALVRLGSELDLTVSERTVELPIVHHQSEDDLGRQLRMANLADVLSLAAYCTS